MYLDHNIFIKKLSDTIERGKLIFVCTFYLINEERDFYVFKVN